MAFFDLGNPALTAGTTAVIAAPSTEVLCEIDSTQLATVSPNRAVPYRVTWIVGAGAPSSGGSTVASIWFLDHALSTGQGSTGVRSRTIVQSVAGQSAQFVTGPHVAEVGDRFRIIQWSTCVNACASINAEPLT